MAEHRAGGDVSVVTVGAVPDGHGRFILDGTVAQLPAALRALCRREAATFATAAAEMGFGCQSLSFDVAYAVNARWGHGDKPAAPGCPPARVSVTVTTSDPVQFLADVIAETEARCPVMRLLLDMDVDLRIDWVRNGPEGPRPVPCDYITGAVREDDFTCGTSLLGDSCQPGE
jgi:hypothetical protein